MSDVGLSADLDLAYLAGFFDGEGSIYITRSRHGPNGRHYHTLSCAVAGVDPRPLFRFQDRFDGNIRFTKRSDQNPLWRDSFMWTVQSMLAETFLVAVRPLLIVKSDAADLALEFRSTKMVAGGARNDAVHDLRERMRERLHAINTGGRR